MHANIPLLKHTQGNLRSFFFFFLDFASHDTQATNGFLVHNLTGGDAAQVIANYTNGHGNKGMLVAISSLGGCSLSLFRLYKASILDQNV